MVKLKCSICGYEYEGNHSIAPCPKCKSVGKIDPRCTCAFNNTFIGVMKGLIKKNKNCPIHKDGSKAKK